MSWGDSYGSPWGGAAPFSSVAIDRVIMFTRGARFRAIADKLGRRTDRLAMEIAAIAGAFNLDDATGVQLTRLGKILQRPRDGMDDELFRRVLRAHVDIILSSQGSTETLLAVFEAITGAPAAEYSEFYPKSFVIGGFVDADEVTLLAEMIRRAKDWGTLGYLSAYPPGGAPGEGGVLLADSVAGLGLWSALDDQSFHLQMLAGPSAVDTVSGDSATVIGSPVYLPAFEAMTFGPGMFASDRLSFSSRLDVSLGQPCTIAAWVRFLTLGGLRVIQVMSQTFTSTWSKIFRTNGNALELAHAYSAGTSRQRISTAVLATGQWYHLVATDLGTELAADTRLFIDGVEASYVTTIDGSGTARDAAGTWTTGQRTDSASNGTDGDVTDVRVWPRVLSDVEIFHLYEEAIEAGAGAFNGPPPGPPPSVAALDLPGVADSVSVTLDMAYPTASLVPA